MSFFTLQRLRDYRESLVEIAVLAIPTAAIDWIVGQLGDSVAAQPREVRWIVLALGVAAWFTWTRVMKRQSLQVCGVMRVFLICYLSAFTVAATHDLLVWKRSTTVLDEQTLPRNWLVPAGWGDLRYLLGPRATTESLPLVVVTIERPAANRTLSDRRNDFVKIIDLGKVHGAIGVGFDYSFLKDSAIDELLCCSITAAKFPVIGGYRPKVGASTYSTAEPYPATLDACFPDGRRGHLLATSDSDHSIRYVPTRLPYILDSAPLSFRIASVIDADVRLPTGTVIQFVEPRGRFVMLPYGEFASLEESGELHQLLKNRFILVGQKSEVETFSTPFGKRLGVQIHAATIYSLLTGNWIMRSPWWYGLLANVVVCHLVTALAAKNWSPGRLALTGTGVSMVLIAFAAMAMQLWLVWVDVIYTIVALWLLIALLLAWRPGGVAARSWARKLRDFARRKTTGGTAVKPLT